MSASRGPLSRSSRTVGVRRRPKIPGDLLDRANATSGFPLRLGDGTDYAAGLLVVTPAGRTGRILYARRARRDLLETGEAWRVVVEGVGAWPALELRRVDP